jgi:PTS system N-acetylglucosamine-specific IIC component
LAAPAFDAAALLGALGGRSNVSAVEAAANRILVQLMDPGRIDAAALERLGVRAVARLDAGRAQLILGGQAAPIADALAGA